MCKCICQGQLCKNIRLSNRVQLGQMKCALLDWEPDQKKKQGAESLWNNKSSNVMSFDSGNGKEVGLKRSVSPFFFWSLTGA